MSKSKPTVELRPSKIRREPPPPPGKLTLLPVGRESETSTVVIGVLLFALAITFLILWTSDYTSH